MAAQITLKEMDLVGNLDVQRMQIVPLLKTAKVNTVVVDSCAFGRLSALTLKIEINNGIRIAKPFINNFLAKKTISFPESVLDGKLTFSELTINYHDSFIGLGITPRFHEFRQGFKSVLITDEDLDIAFLQ
jgi:hypothetical protein